MQYPKDPATTPADHAPEGAQGAHETSFAGEAPQSSVNEPEPFTELENLYAENASLKERVLRRWRICVGAPSARWRTPRPMA